jgi:hypothetical protein
LRALGNARVNAVYEAKLDPTATRRPQSADATEYAHLTEVSVARTPTHWSGRAERDAFLDAKYRRASFVDDGDKTPEALAPVRAP